MNESLGNLTYYVTGDLSGVDKDIAEINRKYSTAKILAKVVLDVSSLETQMQEFERKISSRSYKIKFDFSDADKKLAELETRIGRLGGNASLGSSSVPTAPAGNFGGSRFGSIAGTSNGDVSVANPNSIAGTMREIANKPPMAFPQSIGTGGATSTSADRTSAGLSQVMTAGGGTTRAGKAGELPPLPQSLQSALKNEVMRTIATGPSAGQLAHQLGVPLDDLQAAMQGKATPTQLIGKMLGDHEAFQAGRRKKHEGIANELDDAATKQRLHGLDGMRDRPQFPSWTASGGGIAGSPAGGPVLNPYLTGHVPTPNYDYRQRFVPATQTGNRRGNPRPFSPTQGEAFDGEGVNQEIDQFNQGERNRDESFDGDGRRRRATGGGDRGRGGFNFTPGGIRSFVQRSAVAAALILPAVAGVNTYANFQQITAASAQNQTMFDWEETSIQHAENSFMKNLPMVGGFLKRLDDRTGNRRIKNEFARADAMHKTEMEGAFLQASVARSASQYAGAYGDYEQQIGALETGRIAHTGALQNEMSQIAREQGWDTEEKIKNGRGLAAIKYGELESQLGSANEAFTKNRGLIDRRFDFSSRMKVAQLRGLESIAAGQGEYAGFTQAGVELQSIQSLPEYRGKIDDINLARGRQAVEARGISFRSGQRRYGAQAAGQILAGNHLGAQISGIDAAEYSALEGANPDDHGNIMAQFSSQRTIARRQYNLGLGALGYANAGASLSMQNDPYNAELAGLMSSRQQSLFGKDASEQKLINQQYDLQESALSKSEGMRRERYTIGTESIASSSLSQRLRNVHRYASAAGEDIVGQTSAAIQSVDEPDSKLRAVRVAELRQHGKDQLEGIRTQLRDEMAGATAQGVSSYITRGELRSRPEVEALRDKQAYLKGGVDADIKKLEGVKNTLLDKRFTDPDGKKTIEEFVKTATTFGAVKEDGTRGPDGKKEGAGATSGEKQVTMKADPEELSILRSIDGKLDNVGKAV